MRKGRAEMGAALLLLLLLAGTAAPVVAQAAGDEETRDGLWITAGLGRGSHGGAALLAANFATGSHLVSLRVTDDFGITTTPSQSDVGLLYGRVKRWERAYFQASAGVAYVDNRFGDGGSPDGLGVPLSVGGGWTPLPVLGLGIQAFGDLNETEFFGGVVLTAELALVP